MYFMVKTYNRHSCDLIAVRMEIEIVCVDIGEDEAKLVTAKELSLVLRRSVSRAFYSTTNILESIVM